MSGDVLTDVFFGWNFRQDEGNGSKLYPVDTCE